MTIYQCVFLYLVQHNSVQHELLADSLNHAYFGAVCKCTRLRAQGEL